MSFEQLKLKHSDLIQFLQNHGYSANVIRNVSRIVDTIIVTADGNGLESYRDIYHYYEDSGASREKLRRIRYYIRMIERFDLEGEFPDRRKRSYIFDSTEYKRLPSDFKELLSFYRQFDMERGKKETTIYHESLNAYSFLRAMAARNCQCLDEITEGDALSFFLAKDGTLLRGCSYKKNVSAVFKAGLHWKETPCKRILSFLPAFREDRKTIQYLTEDEVRQIGETLHSEGSGLSLRDRAVGNLLLYTGLRGCDIAGLRMESIDWEYDQIRIVQKKTDVPLELPLIPVVGNAIFDYVCSERPASEDDHVFLTEVPPYRHLASNSIGNITRRIFRAAGVRQGEGERQGTHIFRHHAASQMLEKGTPRPVISRIFGHTSPDSLDPYLMANFKHLKECSLSLEHFPVAEGVLAL